MTPDDGVWENSPEEVPFIEIGGPEGPVGSVVTSADRGKADSAFPGVGGALSSRSSSASQARPYPRLADASQPLYLSVRFHDFPVARWGSSSSATEPDSSLIVFHQPQHPISSEYREVWEAITQQCQVGAHRLVYFVAPAGEAGTTTVVLNLAIQAARQRGQVLVVDAHLERPAAAGRLGLSSSPGLSEVFLGQCPLTLAVQPTCVERLHFLGVGETSSVSGEQVGRSLPLVLSQLRQWYDWVLVDAGVWGEMPQRDAACAVADALYVVARDTDVLGATVSDLRVQVRRLGGQARGAVATRLA
jgi:Mrp family chromosome partitioning ATPase